jgi:hypothetical protein
MELAACFVQHAELGGFATQQARVFAEIDSLDAIAHAIELDDTRQVFFPAGFPCKLVPPTRYELRALMKRREHRFAFLGWQQIAEKDFQAAILFEEVGAFNTLKVF